MYLYICACIHIHVNTRILTQTHSVSVTLGISICYHNNVVYMCVYIHLQCEEAVREGGLHTLMCTPAAFIIHTYICSLTHTQALSLTHTLFSRSLSLTHAHIGRRGVERRNGVMFVHVIKRPRTIGLFCKRALFVWVVFQKSPIFVGLFCKKSTIVITAIMTYMYAHFMHIYVH